MVCLLVGYGGDERAGQCAAVGSLHGNSKIVVRLLMFYTKCRKGGLLLKAQVGEIGDLDDMLNSATNFPLPWASHFLSVLPYP